MSQEGEVARATAMRISAMKAFLRLDAQDKLKRALTRSPPAANRTREHLPGSLIYIWEPTVGKPRGARDPGRWRGPATIISKDGPEIHSTRYYIFWRGRCLLVAAEQLRSASADEVASHCVISKDTILTGKSFAAAGKYQHMPEAKPPVQETAIRHNPGRLVLKHRLKLKAERIARKVVEIPALTDEPPPKSKRSTDEPIDEVKNEIWERIREGRGGMVEGEEAFWDDVEKEHEDYHRSLGKRKASVLNDIPIKLKRSLNNSAGETDMSSDWRSRSRTATA